MPFHISICDDNAEQIKYLRRLVRLWAEKMAFAVQLYEYESAEEFLFKYPDNPCDILLLDIEMGEMNGMELAKKLRNSNDNLPIIFITGYADYMADGYDVFALHYLLKPVEEDKLFSVLDKYIEKNNVKNDDIIVTTENGVMHINPYKIYYIEAQGHHSKIVLSDGKELFAKESLSKFKLDKNNNFVKCYRSIIVNLRYVKIIQKCEIILDDETKIPVSRRLYNDVNKAFIDYYVKDET